MKYYILGIFENEKMISYKNVLKFIKILNNYFKTIKNKSNMSGLSQTHAAFQASDMSIVKEERFVFKTEWYDKQAALIREYLLTYYPKDSTAEMVSEFSNYP